jgi:precorrin-6B methylase 2
VNRRRLVAFFATLAGWSAGAPVLAREPAAPGYGRVAASADGTGRTYMGREIASVMGWQAAGWLERPEREKEEDVERMVASLGLAAGQRVADIGAGTGYVARKLARAVGPTGRVLAVDVQPQMIALLRELAARERLAQIEPVLGTATGTTLPAGSVDVALFVDVYHELEHPFEVLASTVRAVASGGRVVFVEYRAGDVRVPIKPLHTMTVEQIRREAAVHGLVFDRADSSLPWQHVVVFRKR